jgi:proton glutamate symport protein
MPYSCNMKKIPLHWQILIALILAIIYGLIFKGEAISYVSWMGDVFLRALKMLIIPLIISSLISGIANIGSGSNLGRIGLKTISYYVLTSLMAIITGQILVNIIRPGVGADLNFSHKVEGLADTHRTLGETLI